MNSKQAVLDKTGYVHLKIDGTLLCNQNLELSSEQPESGDQWCPVCLAISLAPAFREPAAPAPDPTRLRMDEDQAVVNEAPWMNDDAPRPPVRRTASMMTPDELRSADAARAASGLAAEFARLTEACAAAVDEVGEKLQNYEEDFQPFADALQKNEDANEALVDFIFRADVRRIIEAALGAGSDKNNEPIPASVRPEIRTNAKDLKVGDRIGKYTGGKYDPYGKVSRIELDRHYFKVQIDSGTDLYDLRCPAYEIWYVEPSEPAPAPSAATRAKAKTTKSKAIKLTKAQLEALEELKDGSRIIRHKASLSSWRMPRTGKSVRDSSVKTLIAAGFVTKSRMESWDRLFLTDAGRAALDAAKASAK